MSYSSLIIALKAINAHLHVTSSPPSVIFQEGYYDGAVDIDAVERLLTAHGFKRIQRFRTVRLGDRIEENIEERPVPSIDGEHCIWPTYRMMIEEVGK